MAGLVTLRDPRWNSLFLKDCIPWKGPRLKQFMKNCSPREALTLDFMEDCLPCWRREEWEVSSL